uniref:Uncharacterized protein n=1 Tax=Onchocerca volvulus TaxID=6282 RepID=A0A8R1Y2B7_ONCVO
MWQQAVVTCAFLLFKIKAHLIRSADYTIKDTFSVILQASGNDTMKKTKLKPGASDSWFWMTPIRNNHYAYKQKQRNYTPPIQWQKWQDQRKRHKRSNEEILITLKDEMAGTTLGNQEKWSKQVGNESEKKSTQMGNESFIITISSGNTTATPEKEYSPFTPMLKILISMSIMTILIIIVASAIVLYTTEKRLFMEKQIAMNSALVG